MTAHYFTTREDGKKVAYLIISRTMQPTGIKVPVSGKVEAKKIAASYHAKPWNF